MYTIQKIQLFKIFIACALLIFIDQQHAIRVPTVTTHAYKNFEIRTQTLSAPKNKPVKKVVDAEQLRCMAENIFHEARGESFLGKIAVARVVINRVQHGFARTPCEVIYQKTKVGSGTQGRVICQFSWTCGQIGDVNRADQSYKHGEQIAYLVLAQNAWANLFPLSMLFFHSVEVNPDWPYRRVRQIGNHIFYSHEKS